MKFYKCPVCGKIVEVIQDSAVPLNCCGKPMEELVPGTTDGAVEKHVPVPEINGRTVTVKVGSVEHPMLEAHYIQWIAIETKKGSQRRILHPEEAPEAVFELTEGDEFERAYEYCNIHGLWATK